MVIQGEKLIARQAELGLMEPDFLHDFRKLLCRDP